MSIFFISNAYFRSKYSPVLHTNSYINFLIQSNCTSPSSAVSIDRLTVGRDVQIVLLEIFDIVIQQVLHKKRYHFHSNKSFVSCLPSAVVIIIDSTDSQRCHIKPTVGRDVPIALSDISLIPRILPDKRFHSDQCALTGYPKLRPIITKPDSGFHPICPRVAI